MMQTFFANKKDYHEKKWQVLDAQDQVVGRLASRVARILMGKTDPQYTPHVETGQGVILVNASKVRLTGNKAKTKTYKNFSGYPGGLKIRTFEKVLAEDPTHILMHAVKGMLPKSRLGSSMLTRLLIYPGPNHPHAAQKPKTVSVKD